MSAVLRISDDFFEESYSLVALKSDLEDHSLVYAINGSLKCNFARTRTDLELMDRTFFTVFEWRDEIAERSWALIGNKGMKKELVSDGGLFDNEPSFSKQWLVPEYREADFIFRLEREENGLEAHLIKALMSIPKVIAAYRIDAAKLKQRNNLIF